MEKIQRALLCIPTKPSEYLESPLWDEFELEESGVQPIIMLGKALCFKDETKDDTISIFISNHPSVNQLATQLLDDIMRESNQQTLDNDPPLELIPSVLCHKSIPIEIEPRKKIKYQSKLIPLEIK
jgi:hypothetical protein